MNARTGRPPSQHTWRRNSFHYLAAARVHHGLASLVRLTADIRTRRPPLQELFLLVERTDSLARAAEELTLPDDAEPKAQTAEAIAARASDTCRALVNLTAAWRRSYLPDRAAQQDARRLSNELSRTLMQLAALERRKETTDHDQ
jgi:hypothetical protein